MPFDTSRVSLSKPAIEQLRITGWRALVGLSPLAAVDVMEVVMGERLTEQSASDALRAAREAAPVLNVEQTVADFQKCQMDRRATSALHRLMTHKRVWPEPSSQAAD